MTCLSVPCSRFESILAKREHGARLAALAVSVGLLGLVAGARADDAAVHRLTWAGHGNYRILLRVDAPDGSRDGDERPAEVALDLKTLLSQVAPGRTADLSEVQVIRQEASTGEPLLQTRN